MARDHSEQSTKPGRYALTAAPFVIGMAALYNWVVAPHVGYLHAMQRLEPVMDRMADELSVVSGSLDEKLAAMRAMRGELARLQEGLFTREESQAFFHNLHILVEETGCVMTKVDFTRNKTALGREDPNIPVVVEACRADLTVAGQYEQVVALLRMLRERPRKVWVDSCRLDLVEPRSGRLECQLGLTLYAVLQPGELSQ